MTRPKFASLATLSIPDAMVRGGTVALKLPSFSPAHEGLPGGGLGAVWAAAGMRFADGEVAPSQTLLNEVGPLSPAGALAPTRI